MIEKMLSNMGLDIGTLTKAGELIQAASADIKAIHQAVQKIDDLEDYLLELKGQLNRIEAHQLGQVNINIRSNGDE